MKRRRAGAVKLSGHAYERWRLRVSERDKKKEIANKIKARIATELRNGAEVNRNGALEIVVETVGDRGFKVWAVCYPSLMGGWEVATIIREGCKGCNHFVLQADGQVVEAPCKKNYKRDEG